MSPHPAGRGPDESGLAAPLVVTLTVLLMVLTLVVGGLGRLLVDQRRVSAAADLAALAGAAALQRGGEPCAAAQDTARRNDAELVSCTASGERLAVSTSLESAATGGLLRLIGRPVALTAEAEAGPVP